jgi:hypothetical protein
MIERLSRIWVSAAIVVTLLSVLATAVLLNHPDYAADAREVDFAAIWAAARLALAGEAVAAFDPAALRQAMGDVVDAGGGFLLWLYPAGFHLVVAPLGALPFSVGYALGIVLGIAALVISHRGLAAGVPGELNLVLAAPVTLYALMTGHPAVLFASAMALGLRALEAGAPRAAGLWLGVVAMKPSLIPAVIAALVAGRSWSVLGWAAISAGVLSAAGTLVFGTAHWEAFLAGLEQLRALVAADRMPVERMVSPFAFLRTIGLHNGAALAGHAVVAAAILAVVAVVWSRRAGATDARLAVLAFAVPLVTPYSHYYEMLFVLTGLLFLARARVRMGNARRLLAILIWIVPIPGLVLIETLPLALLAPPLLLGVFVLGAVTAWCPAAERT